MSVILLSSDSQVMKQLHVTDRDEWRDWLSRHHATEAEIWLVFHRKETGKQAIPYEVAVEEALCFGWIDSIIKKIDATRYARKFTPRKDNSNWSALNKKRADKMMQAGRMTEWGLAKIQAARERGLWDQESRPQTSPDIPPEFAQALAQNMKASENFDKLAPSYRKHYTGWIGAAKKAETRRLRIAEAIALLERGEKLGMK